MDQLVCALLSHTDYWYEVGMHAIECKQAVVLNIEQMVKQFEITFVQRSQVMCFVSTGPRPQLLASTMSSICLLLLQKNLFANARRRSLQ